MTTMWLDISNDDAIGLGQAFARLEAASENLREAQRELDRIGTRTGLMSSDAGVESVARSLGGSLLSIRQRTSNVRSILGRRLGIYV